MFTWSLVCNLLGNYSVMRLHDSFRFVGILDLDRILSHGCCFRSVVSILPPGWMESTKQVDTRRVNRVKRWYGIGSAAALPPVASPFGECLSIVGCHDPAAGFFAALSDDSISPVAG
jgi:hypothetical protein